MGLVLHVWGPAFGLPSIDAESIATIAYLNRAVPRSHWSLVADYDTSISPQNEFPVLLDNGRKVTGFSNIISYLRTHPAGLFDLDSKLAPEQQIDQIALTSFLESTGAPLAELYLYISSENYNSTTSSAYTAILPWYINYTIPPRRRDLARARTAHMGLSSLDVNEATVDANGPGSGTASSEYEAAKRAAGLPSDTKPKVLSMGRGRGLGGLLSTPIYAARFKLDTLSRELLEPLSDVLGRKKYLLTDDAPSSLDCFAFAYLALMLYPPVPQAWLKETIQTKYPRIAGYVQRLREELLHGEQVNSAEVWSICSGHGKPGATLLPWRPRCSSTFSPQLAMGILTHMPLIAYIPGLQRPPIHEHSHQVLATPTSSLPGPVSVNMLSAFVAALTAAFAGLAIHHRQTPRNGELVFSATQASVTGNALGEAEVFLSVFASQLPRGTTSHF